MAAKTFTLFKDNFRLDYGRLPTLEETWEAATKAAVEKFTPTNIASTPCWNCKQTKWACVSCSFCYSSNFIAK
jgi:hypothetical protein